MKRVIEIKGKSVSIFIDERPTLKDWIKTVGGQFAILVDLKFINGKPSAGIRTNTSWDPVYVPIPEDVLMTLSEIYQAKRQ